MKVEPYEHKEIYHIYETAMELTDEDGTTLTVNPEVRMITRQFAPNKGGHMSVQVSDDNGARFKKDSKWDVLARKAGYEFRVHEKYIWIYHTYRENMRLVNSRGTVFTINVDKQTFSKCRPDGTVAIKGHLTGGCVFMLMGSEWDLLAQAAGHTPILDDDEAEKFYKLYPHLRKKEKKRVAKKRKAK